MNTKLKSFFVLLSVILWGVSSVWADETKEWSYDEQKKTLSVTTDKNGSSVGEYTDYNLTYDGTTYTSAVKVESETTITFKTSNVADITIGVVLKAGKEYTTSNANIKFDNTATESLVTQNITVGNDNKSEVRIKSFTNVAAGTHTISRGGTELGVFYIKVVEHTTPSTTAIDISDLCYATNKSAQSGLDRTVGGFALSFGGGDGVKCNNEDRLIMRYSGGQGSMTVALDENNSALSMTEIELIVTQDCSSLLTASAGTLTKTDNTHMTWTGSASSVTFTHATGDDSDKKPFELTALAITTNAAPTFSKQIPTLTLTPASQAISKGTVGTYTPTATSSPVNFKWTWVSSVGSSAGVSISNTNNGDPETFTTTAEATAGVNTMTASYTAGENPWFNSAADAATYSLTIESNYSGGDNTVQTYPYTWDFNYGSASWGNTATQLAGFDDWHYNDGNYWNRTNPADAGYTEPIKYKVDVLKGLELSLNSFIGLDWDYTSGSNHYGHTWMGSGSFIQIPNLTEGQTVTFVMEGREGKVENNTATTVALTNASGTTTIPRSEDAHQTFIYNVTADGAARFTFTGAVSIRSIAVSASTRANVTFDYLTENGKLLNEIDKPEKGNEVTHIFSNNNMVRLTAACASDNYNTVEFQKGSSSKTNVKWQQGAYMALSSDKAVIRKVVFTFETKSSASNVSLSSGGGSGSANTTDGTYTWTGESSFVKFTASANVDKLASVYVEYVERTPLNRFSPIGGTTTSFAYDSTSPSPNTTMIVDPNTTTLPASVNDFEVVFTSNREVMPITAGTAASTIGSGNEVNRVHFYNGVTRGVPGTADVYYRYKGNSSYAGKLEVVTYTITKADQTLTFADNSKSVNYTANGTVTNTLTQVGNGEVSYKSSDTNVATVASNGTVTIVNSGVTTITATAKATDLYNAATASYTLTVTGDGGDVVDNLTWDETNFTIPSEIAYGNHANIRATTTAEDKTVKYRSSDESVATVSIINYDISGTSYPVCQITPVAKGTVTITAYVEGEGNKNPKEITTSDITIHGTTFGVQFRSLEGYVTQGKTITPFVKVPNGDWSDFTSVTVSTANDGIATVGAGETSTFSNTATLTEQNGGVKTEGGLLKAIYPTIHGVAVGNTTITLTLKSTKYETTTITYTIHVTDNVKNFAWAKLGDGRTVTEYTLYTGDYMMVPAIAGTANGNWDYSKGTTCETKQAYLYGMRATSPIWNYADFKVGGGYPNYRLTDSNTALTAEQKNSMTNATDKAYILWASSQKSDEDTLMVYGRTAGVVWLHAFDSQTGAELAPIKITILDKATTLVSSTTSYVNAMSYPYTWDFTTDFAVTATPNYWEPVYKNGALSYYTCGYSTMFNWDYCDQDNDGNINEALGNTVAASDENKYFVGANADQDMAGVMPQFYGLTIFSGNSGDTNTKSYESKRDKLRIEAFRQEGLPRLDVVGGIHRIRLPNAATVMPGEETFKLVVKAVPTGDKCTIYKFKNGDHATSGQGTATWKEITDESIVMFDVDATEITGDNYIELGVDNVKIYWIAMSTEAKTINPAAGATGDNIEMMATYSYDKAMDYAKSAEVNGVDAYVATGVSIPATTNPAIAVTMNKANITVPTQTGMLLRAQEKASSTTKDFTGWTNDCYSNGKRDNGGGETIKNYLLSTTVDDIHLESNASGLAKIETETVKVGDATFTKRLNLCGMGGSIGRRYISFPVSGPTDITVICAAEDASKGNELYVGYGTAVGSTTQIATHSISATATTYTCSYNGTATTIYIYGTKGNQTDKTGADGYGIRLYAITTTTKGTTAYMIADAQNEAEYSAPSAPATNLLKGTGNSSRVIYQAASNELCTESGDAYVPFLFSSRYMKTSTGNQVHDAGYFSFWRVWTASTNQGAQKAYLVLPTQTYNSAVDAWGKAADISGNLKEAAASRGMLLRFVDGDDVEDDLTGVQAVEAEGIHEIVQPGNGGYYDMRGIRTERPNKPGLYIHNGKKILVK